MQSQRPDMARILMALLFALLMSAVGVAAAGLDVDSPVPSRFHPAEPAPGDRAEYVVAVMDEGVLSELALPSLRFERLPTTYEWDRNGMPTLAHHVEWEEGGFPPSFLGDDNTTVQDYGWVRPQHEAFNETSTIWQEELDLEDDPNHSSVRTARMYPPGRLVNNCLMVALDPDYSPGRTAVLPHCVLSAPSADPAHPTTTGYLRRQGGAIIGGAMLSEAGFVAKGMATTPSGDALVLRGVDPYDDVWLWFVEEIPYPVQAQVTVSGRTIVHLLKEFHRGIPQSAPPTPIGPLPPVEWTTPRPWGPDDAGVDMPLLPSEAWEIALADAGGELREFLARHPLAYTEMAFGKPSSERNGTEWTFQVRDRNAAIAQRVWRGPAEVLPTLQPIPAGLADRVEVETIAVEEIKHSNGRAPTRIPTLSSAAARFESFSGRAPDRFTYEWGCNGWGTCADGDKGPVVIAADHRQAQTSLPSNLVDGYSSQSSWEYLASRPDGSIDRWSQGEHTWRAQAAPASQAPASAETTRTATLGWATPAPAVAASIGLLSAFLAILYLLWPNLKGTLFGLFSRTSDSAVLNNPTRRDLMEAIRASPGIHLHEVARTLDIGRGTVKHHVGKLRQAGLIEVRSDAGYTCLFAKGTDPGLVGAAAALRSDSAQKVLRAAVTASGSSADDIAHEVGLSRATVHHHLRRLEERGAVVISQSGRSKRVAATALGRTLAGI